MRNVILAALGVVGAVVVFYIAAVWQYPRYFPVGAVVGGPRGRGGAPEGWGTQWRADRWTGMEEARTDFYNRKPAPWHRVGWCPLVVLRH